MKKSLNQTPKLIKDFGDEKKIQKRSIEIVEEGDGSFTINGCTYNFSMQKKEAKDYLITWINGLVK